MTHKFYFKALDGTLNDVMRKKINISLYLVKK